MDETNGFNVHTETVKSSTVLLVIGRGSVRQNQTDVITEIRGLSETDAAKLTADDTYSGLDDASSWTEKDYYKYINGILHQFHAITGKRKSVSARLANPAGMWTVTITESTFKPSSFDANWKNTIAEARTAARLDDGVSKVVSYDRSSQFQWSFNGDAISSVTTTEVREATGLSEAKAREIVNEPRRLEQPTGTLGSATVATMKMHSHISGAFCYIMNGTDLRASSRFISDEEGWGVTVTKTTYGFSGHNWRLPA